MGDSDTMTRLAWAVDSEPIAAVLKEAFARFRDDYTPEALQYVTPGAKEIAGRFAEGPVWVTESGGCIVGTVSVVREPDRLHIRSMAVLPTAQGRGVGGQLLNTVERYAVENDIDTLFLYTTHFSSDAVRLYEKHGFVRGRDTTAEEWCGTPGLEMWKYLNKETELCYWKLKIYMPASTARKY
jgi:ribosomal protein S18 acetylase RimI-like enzyme